MEYREYHDLCWVLMGNRYTEEEAKTNARNSSIAVIKEKFNVSDDQITITEGIGHDFVPILPSAWNLEDISDYIEYQIIEYAWCRATTIVEVD